MIKPVPHVARMGAYALADLTAPDASPPVSLAQNESLRPPCPGVARAVASRMGDPQLYPDPDWTEPRAALAGLHGIDAANILCGNGSLDLIGCLARAFAGPDCAVLAPEHAYPFFRTAARLADARFDTAPESDLHADVDALLDAVRDDTRLVFVANPGNPTGTRIANTDLIRLRRGLPADVLLVIDQAYGEFVENDDTDLFHLIDGGDTVVLGTFSKAYGLAGARVGWGYFPPDIAREVRKVMSPNNISSMSQAAACAAIADQAYMRETCRRTAALRDGFADRLRGAGFDVPASFTNFVLIRLKSEAIAEKLETAMRRDGVIVRRQAGAGLPQCLRVTIADEPALARAGDLLLRLHSGVSA